MSYKSYVIVDKKLVEIYKICLNKNFNHWLSFLMAYFYLIAWTLSNLT